MKRLSIIVPFYNVEKYIEECIRSLYKQDIPQEDYEVICVDDCSPDKSRDIVLTLQKDYPSLILVTLNKNRKTGGARNAGLEIATGEYIWFVDSDDKIAENCLESLLYEANRSSSDILHFNFADFAETDIKELEIPEIEEIISGEDFVIREDLGPWTNRVPIVWNRLHKHEFLLRNELRFVEGKMFEDTDYSLYLFTLPCTVKHINNIAYFHRINQNSVTHQKSDALILSYHTSLLARSVRAYKYAPSQSYRTIVEMYIRNESYVIREKISKLSVIKRFSYCRLLLSENISCLHSFCNWRSWVALKFGFVISARLKKI